MKYLVLVVVVLGVALAQDEEMLIRVSKHEFGKQILQTIQLELTQENAVNQIYTMLNKLFYDLRNEDATASKANGERQAYCGDQLAAIKEVQERAVVALADYSRQVPVRQEEVTDKQNQLAQKRAEIVRNKELLVNFVNQRQLDHQEYVQKRDELISMINGLKQAQQIIRQLQSSHPGGALVELREHHDNLMKQYAGKSAFRKISSILIELCSDAKIHSDNDSVQVILDIVDDLIESIYEVQKKEMFADDWAEKFFQEDMKRLELEVNRLQNANIADEAQVEFLTTRLDELNLQISIQQMVYENKDIEKKEFEQTCGDEYKSNQQERETRQEQIEIVMQLLELFENHFNDRIRAVLMEMFA